MTGFGSTLLAAFSPSIVATHPWRAYVLLTGLAVIWSSAFAVIKIGVAGMGPVSLATGRVVVGALVLWFVLALRGGKLPRETGIWGGFLLIGIFGNGLPFTLIGWGELKIESGLAAILMAVMPLSTLVLAHFFTADERLSSGKVIGVILGFSGIIVLVGPAALAGLGDQVTAQLAVAAGAVCYGIATVIAKRLPTIGVMERAAGVLIAGAVVMIPLALVVDQPWRSVPSGSAILAALYLGLFPTALATVVYFVIITARGASFIAMMNYLIPALGVIWGALFLGETFGWIDFAALALILSGIAAANRTSRITPPVGLDKSP